MNHLEVVTVLNYVELVEDTLEPSQDGPAHRSPLDACYDLGTLRTERLEMATQASTEFLIATLDPSLGIEARKAHVDMLLDKYFTHVEGCDGTNDWCDAPEASYADQTAGCSLGTGRAGLAAGAGGWGLLLLFGAARCRARRRMVGRVALVAGVLGLPSLMAPAICARAGLR